MSRYRVLLPALAILVGALVTVPRPGNTAAGRSSAAIPVGYVDMDELTEKSVVGQNSRRTASDLKTKLEEGLAQKRKTALLSDEELKELAALQAKAQPTDAEKDRIATLLGTSEKLQSELIALNQKQNPSEADRNRINELSQRLQGANQRLLNEKAAAQQELDENLMRLLNDLHQRIIKAVEDEAKARGLAMVVVKDARLFGGENITDSVLNRLKK